MSLAPAISTPLAERTAPAPAQARAAEDPRRCTAALGRGGSSGLESPMVVSLNAFVDRRRQPAAADGARCACNPRRERLPWDATCTPS